MQNYIYLLTQSYVHGYDTYDSIVVCAPDVWAARLISPDHHELKRETSRYGAWVGLDHIDKITVTYLGVADPSVEQGVILSSFNAG